MTQRIFESKVLKNLFMVMAAIITFNTAMAQTIKLTNNWYIQNETLVNKTGAELSGAQSFMPGNWVKTTVPNTVMGALANAGVYNDVFFAKNLENIDKQQFKNAWWYCTEFEISKEQIFENASLIFDGINNYANIWLNGSLIASADSVKGAFSTFRFNVTKNIKKGKNILAVQVFPPKRGDFTIGFVDWTPRPNDENMGIYRPVSLKLSGAVSVNDVFVQTKVNTKTLNEAWLSIEAVANNNTNRPVTATIKGQIENIQFTTDVKLAANESKKIVFTPQSHSVLNIQKPKLWWPYTMGEPNLYTLNLQSFVNKKETDSQIVTFGIREVSDYLTPQGYRGYRINGRDIQIRGGGWMDELFLRESYENLEAQILYTRHMNLNTIRLEGFWGSSHALYDLCDKYGILLMTGVSCQWEWEEYCGKPHDEFGSVKLPEDIEHVAKMVDDQVRMFRNHPSIFVWVLGSDALPRPELEKKYLTNLSVSDPSRPSVGACKALKSEITGITGMKMVGPYDYVTPNYWYVDTILGGAYGFNTETGPGPQVPVLESLERMMAPEQLWPVNDVWDYHCGRNEFSNLKRFLKAFNNRYGEAQNIAEFDKKVQTSNYEAIRPMFEAFAVNKHKATGLIQWMHNAAWPKLFWQLYDYYLVPTAAFYGTRAACKPLNIIYNYGDKNIYVSNDNYATLKGLTAIIKVLDFNSNILLNKSVPFEIGENISAKIFDMPEIKDLTPVYFVDCSIEGVEGKTLARNFYWLSGKEEILDYENSTWFITPNKQYADFTPLGNLQKAKVSLSYTVEKQKGQSLVKAKLKNNSDKLAFFIHVQAKGKNSGKLIVPVLWDDNYISLLPGEERELSAILIQQGQNGDEPVVSIDGWNIE